MLLGLRLDSSFIAQVPQRRVRVSFTVARPRPCPVDVREVAPRARELVRALLPHLSPRELLDVAQVRSLLASGRGVRWLVDW